jgi:hypothetical protein
MPGQSVQGQKKSELYRVGVLEFVDHCVAQPVFHRISEGFVAFEKLQYLDLLIREIHQPLFSLEVFVCGQRIGRAGKNLFDHQFHIAPKAGMSQYSTCRGADFFEVRFSVFSSLQLRETQPIGPRGFSAASPGFFALNPKFFQSIQSSRRRF